MPGRGIAYADPSAHQARTTTLQRGRAMPENVSELRALAPVATLKGMPVTDLGVATAFVDAIVARDVSRAVDVLHPEIDFRAMTPNRVWEADDPAGVETVLRAWLEDPDETVHRVEATEPSSIGDRVRIGWLVRISDADGPDVFEQQAYVRERKAQIDWMRVIRSGWIPLTAASVQR